MQYFLKSAYIDKDTILQILYILKLSLNPSTANLVA